MKLSVVRDTFTEHCTEGQLLVDGVFECYTLEDVVRTGPKVPGATAIPEGEYKVTIDYSNRFKRQMPHILDVPDFEGIRIHSGNTDADTEGCILLGQTRASNAIGSSKLAFNAFLPKLEAALAEGEVTLILSRKTPSNGTAVENRV